jgi:hypothetical protein
MIEVKEREDGSFDISWDENDPSESMFNTWTEQDFANAIEKYLIQLGKNDGFEGERKNLS